MTFRPTTIERAYELARSGVDVRVQSIEGLQWGEMDFPADVDNLMKLSAGWVKETVGA